MSALTSAQTNPSTAMTIFNPSITQSTAMTIFNPSITQSTAMTIYQPPTTLNITETCVCALGLPFGSIGIVTMLGCVMVTRAVKKAMKKAKKKAVEAVEDVRTGGCSSCGASISGWRHVFKKMFGKDSKGKCTECSRL